MAAETLSHDRKTRHVSLIPGEEQKVKALNPDVDARYILAASAMGDHWICKRRYYSAVFGDYEFQKMFIVPAEEINAKDHVRTLRVFLNGGELGSMGSSTVQARAGTEWPVTERLFVLLRAL